MVFELSLSLSYHGLWAVMVFELSWSLSYWAPTSDGCYDTINSLQDKYLIFESKNLQRNISSLRFEILWLIKQQILLYMIFFFIVILL